MSRSKSATPAVNEAHSAHKLTFVDEEIRNQLLKTPVKLLIESDVYETQLKELRSDWRYSYVLQWLYYFRGAIKMIGDPFSVELIEEELTGLTENTLMNKISTNLAAVLIGTKVTPEDFSFKVRYLFGDTTTLLGTEDEPKDFETLSLIDKFDVLYHLIFQVQYTDIFRKQVEKYEREAELRFEPIFEYKDESYFLLSDNRIYKRTINNYPKVSIPRKLKHSKNFNPEVELENIEPEFHWELVAMGIYQIHDFLISTKSDKTKKPLFQNIKEHINDLAQEDLTTRKKVIKRKREQQLNDLVNHRKRSSRLQEKDEQDRIKKQQQEEELEKQRIEYEKLKIQRNLRKKINALKREIEERLRASSTSRRGALELGDYVPSNLDDIELGEGEWLFECYCGIREKNYDDGVKLITCERCHRWQHLKCQDRQVQQELVRNSNDVFVCNWCKQDLEHEVIKKLEEEKLEREREAEEKARHKQLLKQRAEERLLKAEEEERLRKEELEKERQRRIEERDKLKEMINGTTPKLPETQNQQVQSSNGPTMGVFQTNFKQSIPNEQHAFTVTHQLPPVQVTAPIVTPRPVPQPQYQQYQQPQFPTPQQAQYQQPEFEQPQQPQFPTPGVISIVSHEQAPSLKNLVNVDQQQPVQQNTQPTQTSGHENSPQKSFSIQNILQ